MKIGLSLSGGGVRATVFHLGVLARLAKENLLERVSFISTVSGGSLAAGLVLNAGSPGWPTSDSYLTESLRRVEHLLTGTDIQRAYAWRVLAFPWRLLRGRASILGQVISSMWGVHGLVRDLPTNPRWIINATCFETGKNWRFTPQRMGDYLTNYVASPNLALSDAMAASAGFPGLIGPLVLKTGKYSWYRYGPGGKDDHIPVEPAFASLRLWDGGVYDNLGIEALLKPSGFRDGIDFVVVSDAGKAIGEETSRLKLRAALRLVNISMDQVRGLRSRMIVDYFTRNPNSGVLLRMGNTVEQIFGRAQKEPPGNLDLDQTLSDRQVAQVSEMETTLRRLTRTEFEQILRHGYEVADATLVAYCPDLFSFHPATDCG